MKVCYGVNFSVYGYLFFLEEVMVIVKGYFCYFVNVFIGYSVEGYYCFMYNYVVSIIWYYIFLVFLFIIML